MRNHSIFWDDQVNLYILSKVGTALWLKILLGMFNVAFLLALIGILSSQEHVSPALVLGSILALTIWSFTIGRYCLWNIFGEEFITINAEAIQVAYNYGFITTNQQKHLEKTIWYGYDVVRPDPKGAWCRIQIDVQSPERKQREVAFESTILIREETAKEIFRQLEQLFANHLNVQMGFPPMLAN
ncbi:MAG: hypothetical protein AAF206_01010 [Bacteroidota bacterium]